MRAPALLRIAQPQRLRAARHDRGRARRALRVPRLRPLHRALDHDHARDPHRGRLPRGRGRLRTRGRRARRGLPGGDLHAGRAGADRRVVGRGVHRLLRRCRRGRGRDRRDRAPHPRHPARLPARGRARDRALRGEVRRTAAWWASASAGSRRSTRPSRTPRRSASRRTHGLGSVPHAGEVAGPASIRGALDALGADRLRHGIRAVEDADLLRRARRPRHRVRRVPGVERADPGRGVARRAPAAARCSAAGVPCSISTDDPAMFAHRPHGRTTRPRPQLGLSAEAAFAAGLEGALCDDATRARLRDDRRRARLGVTTRPSPPRC